MVEKLKFGKLKVEIGDETQDFKTQDAREEEAGRNDAENCGGLSESLRARIKVRIEWDSISFSMSSHCRHHKRSVRDVVDRPFAPPDVAGAARA